MDDLMRRVKGFDPAPDDADLPAGMWSADAVLEAVDAMSRAQRALERPTWRGAPGPRTQWAPVIVMAAAAFVAAIVIGLATVLLIGGTERPGPVDEPTLPSLPTTLPPPTTAPRVTTPPTTVPPTTAPTTTATTAPTTTTDAAALPVTVTRDVAYSSTQPLDVWAPTAAGPWPVLVVLHGTAVTNNTRSGYDALVERIAAGGAVVYNVEWPQRNQYLMEAEIVACAVGFARSTATDYGGSPERVTLMGHSNGGSMAATVAMAAELLDPVDDCLRTDASIIPDALVGVAGDYDYAISGFASQLRETDPAAWEIVDPYTNIGRNPSLAVYLLHGDGDDAVSVQTAIDFNQALLDAGYAVTLRVLDGVGHNSPVAPSFSAFDETVALVLEALSG